MSSSFIRLLLEIINGSTKLIESSGVAYYFLITFSSVEAVSQVFFAAKKDDGVRGRNRAWIFYSPESIIYRLIHGEYVSFEIILLKSAM